MTYLADPVRAPLVILLASLIALLAAFVAQYGFDLQPCVLCIYQRWPYGIAIALAALAMAGKGRFKSAALALCGLVLAADAGIAGYHVGVEQGWWQGTPSCTGALGSAQTVAELRRQLLATPVVRCDEPAFILFGISMAGYNFLYALALAAIAETAASRSRPREPQQ